jgi:hypothetical protein
LRGGCDFSFLVRPNFSLDGLPVDLDVLRELSKLLIRLLTLVHLKEALSVCYYCVYMRFVVDGDLESTIPLVQLDV